MKTTSAVAFVCVLLASTVNARADDQRCQLDPSGKVVAAKPSDINGRFCQLVDTLLKAKKSNQLTDKMTEEFGDADHTNAGASSQLFVAVLVLKQTTNSPQTSKLQANFLSAVEDSRVDEQVGAASGSAGTTSLTSKGNVPAILGFAVENGALTQSQSGTTITFSGNPVGIIKAIGGIGYLQSYQDDDKLTRRIRDLSFSVSFDTSRGNNTGTFTGDAQQVSAYSFRYAILNHRDPRSSIYGSKWLDLASRPGRTATINEQRLMIQMIKNPAFLQWLDTTKAKVTEALGTGEGQQLESNVEQALSDRLFVELPKIQDQLGDEVPALLNAYAEAETQFLSDRQSILDVASKGSIVTFEYLNQRQIKSPDLSNFKLIAEGSAGKKVDLTANLTFVILNQIPASDPTASRLHDVKVSAQMDIRAGNVARIGSIVLSLSGMYERLRDNALTPGGTSMPNTKGDIALGQFKVTIPIKGSGVKIPLSLTVANRTDLIKESDVRGNIGITLDLDSILGRLNP